MLSRGRKVKRHIILTGFRGVGKTSIGLYLSKRLGFPFYDSDWEIERREGKFVRDLFKLGGEDYFRRLEEWVIKDLCIKRVSSVIASGGGVILSRRNRFWMKESGYNILIRCSKERIYARTYGDKGRPVLVGGLSLEREIEILMGERRDLYEGIMDECFDSSDVGIEVLVGVMMVKVCEELKRGGIEFVGV